MLVTYYYNKDKPAQLPHNNPEYGEPSPLKKIELKEILANCFNIKDNVKKLEAGQIYAFIADKFYTHDYIVENLIQTDGACFCDVDELTEEQKESIRSHWNEIISFRPNLQCIWESFSGNYHVCFWTECLNADEYVEQELTALLFFASAVQKICGITLSDKSCAEKPNLDKHNSSISQRFFLNKLDKDKVLWNENAVPSNFPKLTKEEKEECKKYWPYIVAALNAVKSSSTTYINKEVEYEFNDISGLSNQTDKIEYIEHRARWNIYTCLAELLKDKDKTDLEWERFARRIKEDKHNLEFFLKEPNKNHWFEKRHPHPNYDALTKYGYSIKKKDKSDNCIKKGEWIGKYKDEILDFINENRQCEVVGPTGTGKTSFINGFNEYENILNYNEFSLAKELNAIVLVPFNVTNKLYDSMIEISSENGLKDIKEDRCYVMVWDQALIHWDKIKDRTLIIDEAHCLFLDRTYRDTAVRLMKKIKDDNCKIVLFTATPSGEAEELNCKTLKYTNERNIINLNFLKVNSVDAAQLGCINHCLSTNSFDKIVLFDDMHAKRIYENLMIEGKYINDISYIRADTKDSEDFIYLREKELLNKKLTICTCVAFNGLNFKNENENILVVTSFRKGDTTAAKIIQEAGRIRNSNVTVIVYYDDREYESTLEDRIDKAVTYKEAVVGLDLPDTIFSYDRRLLDSDIVDALRRIENKMLEDSNKEKIIEELIDTGYFIVNDKDLSSNDYVKGDRLTLAIKRQQSLEFIEDLMDDKEIKYREGSYKEKWQDRIKRIISNDGYTGIDINTFKSLIEKKHKNVLIDTVIEKIEKIIKISLLSDYDWNNYVNKIDLVKAALKREIDKRDLMSSYKKNKEIRRKYKDKVKINENVADLNGVMKDLFEELEEQQNSLRQKNIKNGKKCAKKVMDVNTGKTFNSLREAAVYFSKSESLMSKWMKQNKLILV